MMKTPTHVAEVVGLSLATLSFLALVGFFVHLSALNSAQSRSNDCSDEVLLTVGAPHGGSLASVIATDCTIGLGQSSSVRTVSVRWMADSETKEEPVFRCFKTSPTLAWTDDTHLVITLNAVERIDLTESSVGPINIVYRLSPRLRPAERASELSATIARIKKFGHQPFIETSIEDQKRKYEQFTEWSREHVAED
jgi:hypothetical protein